ncbi:hypothetical protein [Bacillus sp. FJAT-29814]|nr:hypothetical protein [Bacillus sp. FJAT-29814]
MTRVGVKNGEPEPRVIFTPGRIGVFALFSKKGVCHELAAKVY